MNDKQRRFFESYLDQLPENEVCESGVVTVDHFCSDEINANICAELVLSGKKTATCSLKHWYDSGQAEMPRIGNLQIVTDWYGEPTSIIKTTNVAESRFSDVTAEFAKCEGEGDCSLKWWRREHWTYFGRECEAEGIVLSRDMLLVLERFEVVYS